ncbi:MAG: hypothetical protein CVV53_01380 [Spirochaetae bacterium HGW-Spirochaetae-9]|nr:MAG: hypothetical protein CVV53_01380 [Spirochaetae bacterium HGW-Spirochaetae-9]
MILLAASGLLFAETLTGLVAKDAKTMGMGGASKVFADRYQALWGNPAALASAKGSLTFADVSAWLYIKPTLSKIEDVQTLMADGTSDEDRISLINQFQAENNGLGGGTAVGLGWAGKGFGLGMNIVADTYTEGLKLKLMTQLNGVVGLAFPFHLGPVTIKAGLDGRIFFRTDSDGLWPLMSMSDNPNVINGTGLAADVGAIVELGPFMVGASVRDLGMEFDMGKGTLEQVGNMDLPLPNPTAYTLQPQVYAGAGVKLGGRLLATSVFAEVSDALAVFEDNDVLWTNLHAGAEVKLLSMLSVRGGLNQGYVSLGAGLDFLFLHADVAMFTEEIGLYAGHRPRSGIAVQAAVRF